MVTIEPGLHVDDRGPDDALPLVLVHGSPDRSSAFASVLKHLAERRFVLYDRRGYGRSLDVGPATKMRDHADDLLAVIHSVGAPAVVVANSFGALVTMLAATIEPAAFVATGLWEPPLPWLEWWPDDVRRVHDRLAGGGDAARMIEAMQRHWLGDEKWYALPDDVRAQCLAEGVAFQADIASEFEAPFEPADVAVPALIGFGTSSRPEFARAAAWLAERVPDADVESVEGVAHYANRTHPREYASFVEAAWARARS